LIIIDVMMRAKSTVVKFTTNGGNSAYLLRFKTPSPLRRPAATATVYSVCVFSKPLQKRLYL